MNDTSEPRILPYPTKGPETIEPFSIHTGIQSDVRSRKFSHSRKQKRKIDITLQYIFKKT